MKVFTWIASGLGIARALGGHWHCADEATKGTKTIDVVRKELGDGDEHNDLECHPHLYTRITRI